MENKRSVWGIVAVIVVVCFIIGSCANSGTPRAEIESAVKKALSTDLTNPADSVFSSDSDTTIDKNSDGSYDVKGYIDCANAFGGKVRNSYVAKVTKNDNGLDVVWEIKNTITGQIDNGENQE